jgi:hypothetical protein
LHAGLRDSVTITNVWNLFDDKGALINLRVPVESVRRMLDRLQGWTHTRRRGQAETEL